MTTPSMNAKTASRSTSWRWIASGAIVVVLLAVGWMSWHMMYVPSDLNLSTTRASAHGLFNATMRPAVDPIPINQIHTWTLHVETAQGAPVENAAIVVNGDMPQHGHGLPTKPEVSKYLGNGDYLVDGMKFQMTGWWVVNFDIANAGSTDRVSFNLMLK
jgi:hypothetical protein